MQNFLTNLEKGIEMRTSSDILKAWMFREHTSTLSLHCIHHYYYLC